MASRMSMIAVCGIRCGECDIYRASNDLRIAKRVADWFKRARNVEIRLEDVRCTGCRGDRTLHWSPDCWILACAVDEKGLKFCHECEEFPCTKLERWANTGKKYEDALAWLKAKSRGRKTKR